MAHGAPPSSEAIARCRSLLPPVSRAKENFREIYRNVWIPLICEGEGAQDPKFQDCVLRSLRAAGGIPENLSNSYNGCLHSSQACLDAMRRLKGLSPATRQYCSQTFGGTAKTDDDYRCVIQYSRKGGFYSEPALLSTICSAKTRFCVEDILGRGQLGKTRQDFIELISACRNLDDPEADRLSCLAESLLPEGDSPVPVGKGAAASMICHPSRRPQKACLWRFWKASLNPGARIRFLTPASLDELNELCEGSTEAKIACLLKQGGRGIDLSIGAGICRYGKRSVRKCLGDFVLGRPPYDVEAFSDARADVERFLQEAARRGSKEPPIGPSEEAAAYRLCVLPEGKARQCVLKAIRDTAVSWETAWGKCADQLPEVRACNDFFAREHKLILAINELAEPMHRITPAKICNIPSDEVRNCVLSGLVKVLEQRIDSLDALIATCHSSILDQLDVLPEPSPCP